MDSPPAVARPPRPSTESAPEPPARRAEPGGRPSVDGPHPTLRTLLKFSLARAFPDSFESLNAAAEALAPILTEELARSGYRIHDTRLCIRVPRGVLGRDMTPEEVATINPQPLPHPRRRA